MVSSRRVDCSIVRCGETLAVKSTNSRAPARLARRFSMASIDWAVFSDAEEASRESRDREKDESIFFETPASVNSPKALFMIAMPWFNITADTTRPEQVSENGEYEFVDKCIPPMGSRGNEGMAQVPRMATRATKLE